MDYLEISQAARRVLGNTSNKAHTFGSHQAMFTINNETAQERERRLNTRTPVTLSVYLSRHGVRFKHCRVNNLSAGGVFVETPALSVPRGTALELIFILKLGKITRIHRLPAVVARINETGAGMKLYGQLYHRAQAG
jgi:hypothetical protein